MDGKEFSREERAFMGDLGFKRAAMPGEALALLVADAEPLSPGLAERIRLASRAKAGVDGAAAAPVAQADQTEAARPARTAAAPRSRRRLLAAAAAILLGLGATVAAANAEKAVAAVQRLFHLIPGLGIQETSRDTLVMAAPVQVAQGNLKLTVTGFIGDSDHTRITVRIEGIPLEKLTAPDPGLEKDQVVLVLADGTRLSMDGGTFSMGQDFKGNITFPPLPPSTSAVTFSLPALPGKFEAFTVPIPLTNVAAADLPEAIPGGWAEEIRGVRIGATDVAFLDDQIAVRVESVVTYPKSRVIEIGTIGVNHLQPTLTDDRGRTYARSDAPDPWDEYSLAFDGPVAAGARRLVLRVPAVEVMQEADALLKIDLAALPIGVRRDLSQTVSLGGQTVVVRTATRETPERLRLDLDLGPEVDGVQLVRFGVQPPDGFHTGGFSWGGVQDEKTAQLSTILLDTEAGAPSYAVRLTGPVVRVRGPWTVDLPAR